VQAEQRHKKWPASFAKRGEQKRIDWYASFVRNFDGSATRTRSIGMRIVFYYTGWTSVLGPYTNTYGK
jgi:hypothetical protein